MPGPHKIYLANPKLLRTIVPTGAYFQTESTLAKAEIEIVTNVINGRWGAAYTNYEHEKIGIELGHLAPKRSRRSSQACQRLSRTRGSRSYTSSRARSRRRASCRSGCSAVHRTWWGTRASWT